jgi:hypothetical protein
MGVRDVYVSVCATRPEGRQASRQARRLPTGRQTGKKETRTQATRFDKAVWGGRRSVGRAASQPGQD